MARGRTKNRKGGRIKSNLAYYRPTKDGKSTMGNVGAVANADHAQYAHALVNPFSAEARGVKLPDDDSTRSVAIQLKWGWSFHSDTNGRVAESVSPEPLAATQGGNSIGSGVVNTWNTATSSPNATELSNAFSRFRIVSWGVRLIPLIEPTKQKGYVRVITTPADPTTGAFTTSGGFFEEVHDFPVANCDVHWVSKPIGNGYKAYIPLGDRASWETVVIYGSGLEPSVNNIFRVEITFNLECEMAIGSITGAISSRAADHNPRVLLAADHARNRVKNTHQGGRPGVMSRLWGAAKEGLIAAAHAYGTPLIGSAARALLGRSYQPRAIRNAEPLEVD